MKVWVVVPDFKRDGYGRPEGIFSSEVAANEYVAKQQDKAARFVIVRMEIDMPEER